MYESFVNRFLAQITLMLNVSDVKKSNQRAFTVNYVTDIVIVGPAYYNKALHIDNSYQYNNGTCREVSTNIKYNLLHVL